jgi:hypothetical protein
MRESSRRGKVQLQTPLEYDPSIAMDPDVAIQKMSMIWRVCRGGEAGRGPKSWKNRGLFILRQR